MSPTSSADLGNRNNNHPPATVLTSLFSSTFLLSLGSSSRALQWSGMQRYWFIWNHRQYVVNWPSNHRQYVVNWRVLIVVVLCNQNHDAQWSLKNRPHRRLETRLMWPTAAFYCSLSAGKWHGYAGSLDFANSLRNSYLLHRWPGVRTDTFDGENGHVWLWERTRLTVRTDTFDCENGHVWLWERTRLTVRTDTFDCENGHAWLRERTRLTVRTDTLDCENGHVWLWERIRLTVRTDTFDCENGHVWLRTDTFDCENGHVWLWERTRLTVRTDTFDCENGHVWPTGFGWL